MRHSIKTALAVAGVVVLCGAGGDGCTAQDNTAAKEQQSTDRAMTQIARSQPVPVFDYSLERHMLTEIYKARQRATNTFSVVQSDYTGKVLWSCPSLGYPVPYATQLTNPHQLQAIYGLNNSGHWTDGVVEQPEPNGLYSPAQSDATWVPCVGPDGKVTPVYEEKHVTVFLQPMQEQDGRLVPVAGSRPSFAIEH